MRNILLIHGVNLNALGKRDQEHYGIVTLKDIEELTHNVALAQGFNVIAYQSNHEGDLVDKLQMEAQNCAGIIINPGAFAHYSYGLHDALLDTKLPVIEVHLSNINNREAWRRQSVISPACLNVISGKREDGYRLAVTKLVEHINHANN